MLALIMLHTGSIIIAVWGVAHIAPTKSIVAGCEPLSMDNRRVLTMEWVSEAAVASNCTPCVVFHIRAARDRGLTDSEIMDAVESANKAKQVPAELVLNAAHQELTGAAGDSKADEPAQRGCGCQT
jgi:AhpD family alkylhydroperoxidase